MSTPSFRLSTVILVSLTFSVALILFYHRVYQSGATQENTKKSFTTNVEFNEKSIPSSVSKVHVQVQQPNTIAQQNSPPASSRIHHIPKVYEYYNGRIFDYTTDKIGDGDYSTLDLSDMESVAEYIVTILNRRQAECTTSHRFGSNSDGGWDACLVGPYYPKLPCLVLSFGINYDFTFDDDVEKRLNCTVHAYDPTMKNMKSYQRSKRIYFHKLGLYGSKQKNLAGVGEVDTLKGIKEQLGYNSETIIDILKVDVELSEYAVLKTALNDGSLKNVKQLAIELHFRRVMTKDMAKDIIDSLNGLRKAGFLLWKFSWNTACLYKPKQHNRTFCHELYFINVNFLSSSQRNAQAEKSLGALFYG